MPELKYDRWILEWEDIGEGYNGEYDEEDPDDKHLYRATLLYTPDLPVRPTSHYFTVVDGSYCTLTPSNTPMKVIHRISNLLFHALPEELELDDELENSDYESIEVRLPSRVMERWTWTTDPDQPLDVNWNTNWMGQR